MHRDVREYPALLARPVQQVEVGAAEGEAAQRRHLLLQAALWALAAKQREQKQRQNEKHLASQKLKSGIPISAK